MTKTEKVLIYPYNAEFAPVLRHRNLLQNYTIHGVVSPSGWGFTGKDAGIADRGHEIGLIVEDNFDEMLLGCDTVLFCETDENNGKLNIEDKLVKASESNKNIVCTIELDDSLREKVENICISGGKYFKYLCNSFKNPILKETVLAGHKVYEPGVPILMVMGNCHNTGKFEIQLGIRERFLELGYKVSQIGSRSYCELLGFHSFPQFMYGKEFYEHEKIALFNHYIKNIEKKEDPDIIIIGIPGSTMSFNNEYTNKFGVLAYEVTNAVIPDAVIYSVLYSDVLPQYYSNIAETTLKRFSSKINCFNISNMKYQGDESREKKKFVLSKVDLNAVNNMIAELSGLEMPVYNILETGSAQSMCNCIIGSLSD